MKYVSIKGQIVVKTAQSGNLKYIKYQDLEAEVEEQNAKMAVKKLIATTVSSRSEDISVTDAEILRLIEERRNTPKGEKHKLKDVSKCIKRCIRDAKRMKRQRDIQRILEEFKGVRNIPGIKSAKKRVLITKIK